MRRRILGLVALVAFISCSSDPSAPDNGGNTDGGRHIAVQAGATQSGIMGQPTTVPPTVIITNDNGDPVAGIVITFSIVSGGGTVSTATATTSASGVASIAWTLGRSFATQALDATASGVGSVGFLATATPPEGGIVAFNSPDTPGDTLAYTGVPAPKALDLVSIRGDFKRDSLIVTLTFSSPVTDAALGGPTGLYGFLEFDMDDKLSTGFTPEANNFGATANLGIDFFLDLFDEFGTRKAVLHSALTETMVPATYSGNTVVVRLPMQFFGNDDGSFTVVGVVGLIDRATDVVPNAGGLVVRPN